MRLQEVASSARKLIQRTTSKAFEGVARFAKLERVLAFLCLLIPGLLILFDGGSVRDSISAYYDMEENQIFYFPLTVAAMLFIVNGVLKERHGYNIFLGLMLAGVILFNHDDFRVPHLISAVAFFGGNAGVILLFSRGYLRRFKVIFIAGILASLGALVLFDGFTLFWAEWLSFAIIAIHYILASLERAYWYQVAPGRGEAAR